LGKGEEKEVKRKKEKETKRIRFLESVLKTKFFQRIFSAIHP